MVQNIRLDIVKRYTVVLVVKKGGSKMPKKRLTTNGNVSKRIDGRRLSVIWYFDEQGQKMWKTFFWIIPNYKKRSMSGTSSKVEIEQTPAGTGLLFRLSHKVEIPCEEAPLTSLERESPKWITL